MGERLEGSILLAALIPVLGIDVILEIRSQTALKKLATNVGAAVTGSDPHRCSSKEIVPTNFRQISLAYQGCRSWIKFFGGAFERVKLNAVVHWPGRREARFSAPSLGV
jgi:hypothetical protein